MWITAFLLGFAGSLHCVGMCSPLAMAVTSVNTKVLLNKILYNGGRIFTYAILGAFISTFGFIFNFSSAQHYITILLAAGLIIMGLTGIRGFRIPVITPVVTKFTIFLKHHFAVFIKNKRSSSMVLLGMINGLLPCGLTYLALTYCLTLDGAMSGFNFMLMMGAGTLPAMLGSTSLLYFIMNTFKIKIHRLVTITLVVLGCLLIGRVVFQHEMHTSHHTETTTVICD